jgi:probable blue pigment (indigoidine) exporter
VRHGDRTEILLFAVTVAIYSGGWIAAEVALRGVAPISLAAYRFLVAGAVLVVVARVTHHSLGLERPWTIISLAFFGLAASHALLYFGLRLAPATDGVILSTALTPILSMAFAVGFLGERLSWRGLAGAAVGLAGVLLVVVGPRDSDARDVIAGDVLMALGAALVATYTVLGRVAMRTGSPMGVAGSSTIIAGAMLLPFALIFEGPVEPASWSPETWLAFGYLTLPSAVLAASVYFFLVQRSGAVRATLVQYIVPVAVFALSALLLGEAPAPVRIIGAGLAVLGTRLVLTDKATGILATRDIPQETYP